MFEFVPVTKTVQNDFFVNFQGNQIGILWIKRNHPKPTDKCMVIRNLLGDVAVRPSENEVRQWLIENAIANNLEWVQPIKEALIHKGILKNET